MRSLVGPTREPPRPAEPGYLPPPRLKGGGRVQPRPQFLKCIRVDIELDFLAREVAPHSLSEYLHVSSASGRIEAALRLWMLLIDRGSAQFQWPDAFLCRVIA